MRRFLKSKGIISGSQISLFEGEKLVKNESKIVEILNVPYNVKKNPIRNRTN